MNQIVSIRSGAPTGAQLDLIKRTVAKDTDAAEFDHFMHTASHLGLDPLRKQILCMVFNKTDPKKRNMAIIVPQDGLRVIAARQRDYGPARDEPEIEYDPDLKSDVNPHGIVRAKVTLWKLFSDGWQPVVGVSYWDEFAAIDEEIEWRENDQGKRYPHKTGKLKLADNWRRMGRVMIAKCATCQALRAGWPDDFAGVYGEEEMQRAVIIDAASEVVAEHQEMQRRERVGMGEGVLFLFEVGGNLIHVERGNIADRLNAYYEREARTAQEIIDFRQRNEASLKTFWTWAPSDALELKKVAERRIGELAKKVATESGPGASARTDKGAEPAQKSGDANAGGPTRSAPSSPAQSPFEALKEEGLAILQAHSKAQKAKYAEWLESICIDKPKCSPAEQKELDTLEENIAKEIGL